MNSTWWYLCRASGIVATGLAVGSLVLGLFFSARNTGVRRTPAWWLDLHNYLGGLALVFTGAHVVTAMLDPNSGVGLVQVLIPGTFPIASWALTWGVLAAYVFTIVVFTSWPKRRFTRPVWRAVHLASVAGVAFAGVHAYMLGSEATAVLFQLALAAAAMIAVYAVGVRLLGIVYRQSERPDRRLASPRKP